MKTIPAKSIVYQTDNQSWFGCKYTMNIYRGCIHGCIYCDSRSSCYQVEEFDQIVAKENSLQIIARELKGKRKKGIVGTGAMSDPYNPYEQKHKLTQGALELIKAERFGVTIITKSDLVVRDQDILLDISNSAPVCVGITITAATDSLARRIEPAAPSSSRRFAAIRELSESGVYCGVLMTPILPFITDSAENIRSLVEQAAHAGAQFIYPFIGVTIRDGQREYFYQALDRSFPGLRSKYIQHYGANYQCFSPKWLELSEIFAAECKKHKLACEMSDIIASAANRVRIQQLSLF